MKIGRLAGSLPMIGLIAVGISSIWMLGQMTESTHAQTSSPSQVCRSAVIIDRSGSVGGNMPTLKEQIRRVFQPTGLYDDKIQIAFWSFSHVITGPFGQAGNYNAPFFGYVSSRGENSGFMNALSTVQPAGNTNYQQAFAYDGATRNPALNDIIEGADILVFLTDGQPNSVNQNGISAEEAGRQAAQKHLDAGRVVIGGSIGANAAQVRVINYVVTNDRNNSSNTFTVSTNYNDLALKLKQQIGTKCSQLFPPEPCPYNSNLPKDDPNCVPPVVPAYNLLPMVTSDNTVISSDESATFHYRVTNESTNVTTGDVGWSIKRVVVDKTQPADPLYFGADPHRDDYSCPKLVTLINNKGTCNDVASGTKQFGPGATVLSDFEVGAANRIVVDDRWPVGTKVCHVLTLAKPTEKDAPVNRFSRAVCVVIGKRPTVQIWGADINVGGVMAGDTEAPNPIAAKIQTGLTMKGDPINKTFGSWAEYGAFAPGIVNGLGTAAELQGGLPGSVASQQGLWSQLTFANMNDEYGSFTEARTIPDITTALLANQSVVPIATDNFTIGTVNSGVYEKQTPGGLTLAAGVLGKGKSVIVYVPNDTVTIEGNLTYTDEALGSVNDIPRLVIIARNINIKASVTTVDAWLVARNSPSSTGGGIINTCSDGPDNLTITDCDQQLRINGLIIARHLVLKRTAGAGSGEASDQPGEIINLRADAYLSSLAGRNSTSIPTTSYSVELPPRF